MNKFLLLLSALAAPLVNGQGDLWNINDPQPTVAGNVFTIPYEGLNNEIVKAGAEYGQKIWFGTFGCKDEENSQELWSAVYAGFAAPAGTGVDVETWTAAEGATATTGTSILAFKADMSIISNLADYYTPSDPATAGGELKFCVRFSICLEAVCNNEVNFLETQVTVTIAMNGNFDVDSLTVAPKAKTAVQDEITYTVEAEICEKVGAATEYTATAPGKEFNQGDVISVCIFPDRDDGSRSDGIIMDSIETFTWYLDNPDCKSGGGEVTPESLGSPDCTSQVAVQNSIAANTLTTIDSSQAARNFPVDGLEPKIAVQSVLFATFFTTSQTAAATGSALMKFPAQQRRLRESGSISNTSIRRLADEGIPPSPFDVSAGLNSATDGPTLLQTAAGSSRSFAAVATFVGLVSAMLLA